MKDHYPSDDDVFKDTELQEWIDEIFTQGFLENKQSGEQKKTNSQQNDYPFNAKKKITNSLTDRSSSIFPYGGGGGEVCHHGDFHRVCSARCC